MSLLDALARARAKALERMTETVTAGSFTWGTDPETFNPTRTTTSTAYAGVARLHDPTLIVSQQAGPAQPISEQNPTLSVPAETELLPENTEVVCDSSRSDSRLVGRRYRINGTPQMGQTSAHRYPLEVLS